jgi:hypothetical protein
MKDEYLQYIVLLERSLADFYGKFKNEDHLQRIKSTLEFMETHSMGHAERINETIEKMDKPALGSERILNYQNSITGELAADIRDNKDPVYVLKKLAGAEEKLGDLYKNMAAVMLELSDYYRKAAAEVSVIADEEYGHRDILLRDMAAIERKK